MHSWPILFCMLWWTASAAVPVWTWVDDAGRKHFSDRPAPGALRIELGSAPVISLRSPPQPAASASAPEAAESTPATSGAADPAATGSAAPPAYTTFVIASPADGQTLWNTEGRLEVTVELAPALQPGHRLRLDLDGRRLELPGAGPAFTVPDVYRGLHTIGAAIVNDRGQEMLRSPGVTFAVRQTSVLNPNNPQNRR